MKYLKPGPYRGGDHVAGSAVDGLERNTRLRRFQRRILSSANDLEDALHLVGGFAQHERAAEIRLVAFNAAAAVDEEDRPLADCLRGDRSVRQRRILADLHARLAGKTKCVVSGRHQIAEIVLRHALA